MGHSLFFIGDGTPIRLNSNNLIKKKNFFCNVFSFFTTIM